MGAGAECPHPTAALPLPRGGCVTLVAPGAGLGPCCLLRELAHALLNAEWDGAVPRESRSPRGPFPCRLKRFSPAAPLPAAPSPTSPLTGLAGLPSAPRGSAQVGGPSSAPQPLLPGPERGPGSSPGALPTPGPWGKRGHGSPSRRPRPSPCPTPVSPKGLCHPRATPGRQGPPAFHPETMIIP